MTGGKREIEFAFVWQDDPKVVSVIKHLASWHKSETRYTIKDTIYDTPDNSLAGHHVGVRVRTKRNKTTLTAKKFLGKGSSGEGLYDEYHENIEEPDHPNKISRNKIPFVDTENDLIRKYEFTNRRYQIEFTKDTQLVRVINERVTYSNEHCIVSEALLEVEFEGNIEQDLISKVKDELLATYLLSQIHEGKTNRAERLLRGVRGKLLLQNIDSVKKQRMHAHGGKGLIDMWFFHQPYSRFYDENIPRKVIDYTNINWDFFAYAELPIGADVKYHEHDKTDEIYFILDGHAIITVDGVSSPIQKGDCILTRKGSSHSLTNVTEMLKFIAVEIYR